MTVRNLSRLLVPADLWRGPCCILRRHGPVQARSGIVSPASGRCGTDRNPARAIRLVRPARPTRSRTRRCGRAARSLAWLVVASSGAARRIQAARRMLDTRHGRLQGECMRAHGQELTRHELARRSGEMAPATSTCFLLDKTGTITLGNRQAAEFLPVDRCGRSGSWPRWRSSPRSPTRRRRAARSWCWRRSASGSASARHGEHVFVPFSATTRISGIDPERQR